MTYSVQPTDRIFVKGYGFLSFAKNVGKNIGKNISNNLSGIYSPGMLPMCQKIIDHAKQSATASKRAILKTVEVTGNLIGIKIANVVAKSYGGKITGVSKNLQQNNSETVTKEIPPIHI